VEIPALYKEKRMKIKTKTYQNRRDFNAIMICEHCGNEEELNGGYDDAYYHNNVIPAMKCEKCGKTAEESYKPMATVYPEGFQV